MNQGHHECFGEPISLHTKTTTSPSNDVFYTGEMIFSRYTDPVVVYIPVGNYNDLKEFGRFKNLSVAMTILSSFNNPDEFGGIPEYHIFSLETGAKIQLH